MPDSQSNSQEGIDFISAPPPPGESVDRLQALVDQQAEKKEDPEKDAEVKQQAAETLLYTHESLSRKKIQELQKQQKDIFGLLSGMKENKQDPEKQLAHQERRDALEKQNEALHQQMVQVSKEMFAQMSAIKGHLEKQENKTPEQEEKLKQVTKELDSVYPAVRYVELEGKIQRSDSQQQEMEKLKGELPEMSLFLARHLVDDAIARDMDVKHPIDLDKDKVVREYNDGRYQVEQTQDIINGLEEKLQQKPEKMQAIHDRVGRIRDAFSESGNIPERTMGVLENMIWRYASNNVDRFSGEKEYPFLAQDVSTKQAFIYYPNGQVEVSRAFHGSGPIGNVPESYGSSLGSKWLKKGHVGGDYRYRLYMHGLEKGVNDNDHGRMCRVHEKRSGNTIGCTGLPPAVMARFHAAVSQAGGGFQETFISNGSPIKEQLLPGLRSSGGSVERAVGSPSFSNRSEMEQFLAALDQNPLAKLMFALIAPFGLMVAQAKGDKVMEEFWNRILGNDTASDYDEADVSSRQSRRAQQDAQNYTNPSTFERNKIQNIEGVQVHSSPIANWEGIDYVTNRIGAASGHTIGTGYDLKYYSPGQIQNDWGEHFSPEVIQILQSCSGKNFSDAHARSVRAKLDATHSGGYEGFKKRVRKVAPEVLERSILPQQIQKTLSIFPQLRQLSPEAQTALVSIVFNRGTKLSGSTRVDMLNIRKHLEKIDDYKDNPQEFYSILAGYVEHMNVTMASKWRGAPGVIRRRKEEAAMIRSNTVFVEEPPVKTSDVDLVDSAGVSAPDNK